MDKKKVLHIFSAFGGGISSLVFNLTNNKTDDFIFDTLAFSYNNGKHFVEMIEKQSGNCYTMPSAKREPLKFFKYIDELFKEHHYDAIHCHISGWMAVPFAITSRKYGVKTFVMHAHSSTYDSKIDRLGPVYKLDKYLNYKYATDYMICSDLAGDYLFGEEYLKKKGYTFIPNGVNRKLCDFVLTEQQKQSIKDELQVVEGTKLVLHVGRFVPQKNHSFIIEIAKKAKETGKYTFVLVGDGSLEESIRESIAKNDLGDVVKIAGRRTDVAYLMESADCMILPSQYEGLPTVAVECQANGTPMILSDAITKLCDMGLGLVEFTKTDSPEKWLKLIDEYSDKKVEKTFALQQVVKNGFTDESAGKLYCQKLLEAIERNEN